MAGTRTPNINLYQPIFDEEGWDDEVNGNFATIDTEITKRLIAPTSPASGDIVIRSGSAWALLAAGAANHVIIGNGVGQIPSYAALVSSMMTVDANVAMAGHRLTGCGAPQDDTDGATKGYVIAACNALLAQIQNSLTVANLQVTNLSADAIAEKTAGHGIIAANPVVAPAGKLTYEGIVASATVIREYHGYWYHADGSAAQNVPIDIQVVIPQTVRSAGTLRITRSTYSVHGHGTMTIYKNTTIVYTQDWTTDLSATDTDISVIGGDVIRVVISCGEDGGQTYPKSADGYVKLCGTVTTVTPTGTLW